MSKYIMDIGIMDRQSEIDLIDDLDYTEEEAIKIYNHYKHDLPCEKELIARVEDDAEDWLWNNVDWYWTIHKKD